MPDQVLTVSIPAPRRRSGDEHGSHAGSRCPSSSHSVDGPPVDASQALHLPPGETGQHRQGMIEFNVMAAVLGQDLVRRSVQTNLDVFESVALLPDHRDVPGSHREALEPTHFATAGTGVFRLGMALVPAQELPVGRYLDEVLGSSR